MKYNMKYIVVAGLFCFTATACSDFLDRPVEDGYNVDNYYQTDEQCVAGVNYLYNSPWYDFQRGFFNVGEGFSGNMYLSKSGYDDFSINGTNSVLINMSYSLWAVIGHANTVYNNIKNSPASAATKNQCMGECLTWKAMAYFYLVRAFGEVPIVHDNETELTNGTYNTAVKVKRADIYEYIIMTLEKAMELLPKSSTAAGRIDYYCAEGLLSKVYLTKAGVTGSLSTDDLAQAAKYAKDVIDNSGRKLMENYEDIFRLANNTCEESLIAWRWTANGTIWTAQNSLQCDLGLTGFDEFGDTWGDWTPPSVDLQEAFGVKLLEQAPDAWINTPDKRLKATMFLPGYTYSYFWADKGGFDYLRFIYDTDYNASAGGQLNSGTGSNCVKHLYGNAQDHMDGIGHSAAYMYNSLATHLLRLSDVYLIYAEAKLGTAKTTTDASAIDAFYQVRHRARSNYSRPSSITWDDVWKERRLELALEGDRWYDYVRVSYYDPDFCVNELVNQKRNGYNGLNDLYKGYYETGKWAVTSSMSYDTAATAVNPESMMKVDPDTGKRYFFMPFPTEDVVFNPNLGSNVDGVHVDVRATYSY